LARLNPKRCERGIQKYPHAPWLRLFARWLIFPRVSSGVEATAAAAEVVAVAVMAAMEAVGPDRAAAPAGRPAAERPSEVVAAVVEAASVEKEVLPGEEVVARANRALTTKIAVAIGTAQNAASGTSSNGLRATSV